MDGHFIDSAKIEEDVARKVHAKVHPRMLTSNVGFA